MAVGDWDLGGAAGPGRGPRSAHRGLEWAWGPRLGAGVLVQSLRGSEARDSGSGVGVRAAQEGRRAVALGDALAHKAASGRSGGRAPRIRAISPREVRGPSADPCAGLLPAVVRLVGSGDGFPVMDAAAPLRTSLVWGILNKGW